MYQYLMALSILICACTVSARSVRAQCTAPATDLDACTPSHTFTGRLTVLPCDCILTPIDSSPWVFPRAVAGAGVSLQGVPKKDLSFVVEAGPFGTCPAASVKLGLGEDLTYSPRVGAPTFTYGDLSTQGGSNPSAFNGKETFIIPDGTWTGGGTAAATRYTATLLVEVTCAP